MRWPARAAASCIARRAGCRGRATPAGMRPSAHSPGRRAAWRTAPTAGVSWAPPSIPAGCSGCGRRCAGPPPSVRRQRRSDAHALALQERFVAGLDGTGLDPARLVVPLEERRRGNFLAFSLPDAGGMAGAAGRGPASSPTAGGIGCASVSAATTRWQRWRRCWNGCVAWRAEATLRRRQGGARPGGPIGTEAVPSRSPKNGPPPAPRARDVPPPERMGEGVARRPAMEPGRSQPAGCPVRRGARLLRRRGRERHRALAPLRRRGGFPAAGERRPRRGRRREADRARPG